VEAFVVRKEPTKTGFEVDVVHARRIYKYTGRAGVCKKAKRQMNRRNRHEWRQSHNDKAQILSEAK